MTYLYLVVDVVIHVVFACGFFCKWAKCEALERRIKEQEASPRPYFLPDPSRGTSAVEVFEIETKNIPSKMIHMALDVIPFARTKTKEDAIRAISDCARLRVSEALNDIVKWEQTNECSIGKWVGDKEIDK